MAGVLPGARFLRLARAFIVHDGVQFGHSLVTFIHNQYSVPILFWSRTQTAFGEFLW